MKRNDKIKTYYFWLTNAGTTINYLQLLKEGRSNPKGERLKESRHTAGA